MNSATAGVSSAAATEHDEQQNNSTAISSPKTIKQISNLQIGNDRHKQKRSVNIFLGKIA